MNKRNRRKTRKKEEKKERQERKKRRRLRQKSSPPLISWRYCDHRHVQRAVLMCRGERPYPSIALLEVARCSICWVLVTLCIAQFVGFGCTWHSRFVEIGCDVMLILKYKIGPKIVWMNFGQNVKTLCNKIISIKLRFFFFIFFFHTTNWYTHHKSADTTTHWHSQVQAHLQWQNRDSVHE